MIIERIPQEAYEARLGERVVFQTSFAYVVEHQEERREIPGIVPRIIGAFLSVSPFDEVLVLSWFDFGNACSTHGYSFIGIHRDGTFQLASLSACTEAEPQLDSDTKRVRLIIPPRPPGIRHGDMNPLVPGEEWIFMNGKLNRTRRFYKL